MLKNLSGEQENGEKYHSSDDTLVTDEQEQLRDAGYVLKRNGTSRVYSSDHDDLHVQQPFADLYRRLHRAPDQEPKLSLLEQIYQDGFGDDKDPHTNVTDDEEAELAFRDEEIFDTEAHPAAAELTTKETELIRETGPKNEYDLTAAQAQLKAEAFGDFELLRMGTHLSYLIQTIPYDHDHFYKVTAAMNDIKTRMRILEGIQDNEIEEIRIPADELHGYKFKFKKLPNGGYQIAVSSWNNLLINDTKGLGKKAENIVSHFLFNNFDYYKREISTDRYRGASDLIETYLDRKGREVYYRRDHRHGVEGGGGIGMNSELTVYENPLKAKEIWDKVKNLITEVNENSTGVEQQ